MGRKAEDEFKSLVQRLHVLNGDPSSHDDALMQDSA